jgi:hypothetical protein
VHPILAWLEKQEKTQAWLRAEMERLGRPISKGHLSQILNDKEPCSWEYAAVMCQIVVDVAIGEVMSRGRDVSTDTAPAGGSEAA